MKKSITSNPKIKCILLSILFSILFIFTALYFKEPLVAYAAPSSPDASSSIGQVMNLNSYSANETDESSNEQAGYLYWAASADRSGIMYYVVDQVGVCHANGILLDKAGKNEWGNYANYALESYITAESDYIGVLKLSARTTLNKPHGVGSATDNIDYVDGISTVYYSDGWQAKGSAAMEYLMADSGQDLVLPSGYEIPLPNWAFYVLQSGSQGLLALQNLAQPDTKWKVILEPVTVDYLYTDNHFTTDTVDATGMHWSAGSPMPAGATNSNGWEPKVYFGTAWNMIDESNYLNESGGGQYTYKFYNTQLPFSLCLDHAIEIPVFTGGSTSVSTLSEVRTPLSRIYSKLSICNEGIAIASIDISGFSFPPLHTFDGTNTPGNTEPPSDDNGTSGDCTIKKLYYTQYINSDGTIEIEATDYHSYTQTLTTNYISIDNEDGYELEGWKASASNSSLTTKEQFNSISATHSGTSSQEITLDEATGEKYLYVLLKKTEVNPNPPDPWDSQLQESQITKRVTFLESSGPANTSDLITHNFTWTAPAPSITSCQSHGGNGHHLNCSKEWDTAPVSGTAHTHTDSCYTLTCTNTSRTHIHSAVGGPCYSLDCTIVWDVAPVAGVPHSHSDSCYDTPCTNFQWTDNTTKLGITLDTSSINKAVVSKNWSVTYNATTVNTITSCLTHMGLFFCKFLDYRRHPRISN